MDTQQPIDYYKIFSTLIKRSADLTRQRDAIDAEITKVRQLIVVTFPLIPEEKQRLFRKEIDEMEEQPTGLLDAIKLVFSAHKGEWLTVSQVRDYLLGMGFDFRHYRTNPLASIGTTLKRMVPTHLESMNSGSGTLYQRRKTIGDRMVENYMRTVPPPPACGELPVSDPSHPIHHAEPIVKIVDTGEFKPKYGQPDPLNRRGKK
jgi:hypothetical protein